MAKIHFKFEDENIKNITIDDIKIGETILDITEDNNIDLNHNCGAVCACSTCQVYVTAGGDQLDDITDTEEDMIDRADNPTLDSRLACQCVILHDETELTVTIPDQSGIIGHEH